MGSHRMLIRGGIVISLDPAVGDLARGDVLIEDGVIAQVAQNISVDAEVLDARDMIVIPGFVDAHRHSWQSTLRNVNSDMTFPEYFATVLPVYGPLHRPQDMYAGTLVGALEALDAGVTTMVDFVMNINVPEDADAVVAALRESGIRAVFAHGAPCAEMRSWWVDSERPHPEDARRVREQYFSSDDQLVTFAMALRGPERTTAEINRHDFRFARELAARITLHVDVPGAIESMHDYVRDDTVYVHCCRSTDRDLDLIAESGGFINVTPECEMGLHNEPITGKVLQRGLRPSLGVDSAAPISGDMFVQMRMALQQERMRLLKEGWLSGDLPSRFPVNTRDALEWATIEGARAFGLDRRVGSITPGKDADLVLLRADGVHLTPLSHPVAAVVQSAGPRDVDTVLVRGVVAKRHGRLVYPGLAKAQELVRQSRDSLFDRGGEPKSIEFLVRR